IGLDLPAATQRNDHIWRQNRQEITSYVRALHASASDGATPFSLIWQSLRARTTLADLTDAFRGVKIETNLLQNPDRLSEITGDIEIFTGVAQPFVDSFGHPSRSPWSKITFGDFPAYDAPSFIQALSNLRSCALTIQDAIKRYTHLGVASVED